MEQELEDHQCLLAEEIDGDYGEESRAYVRFDFRKKKNIIELLTPGSDSEA